MMLPEELKQMRELCEAATSGPWSSDTDDENRDCVYSDMYGHGDDEDDYTAAMVADCSRHYDLLPKEKEANSIFIAHFNPTRALELLDEITLLQEQVKCGVELYHSQSEEIERLQGWKKINPIDFPMNYEKLKYSQGFMEELVSIMKQEHEIIKSQLSKAVEVIRFYADEKVVQLEFDEHTSGSYFCEGEDIDEWGKRAREFLSQLEGEK